MRASRVELVSIGLTSRLVSLAAARRRPAPAAPTFNRDVAPIFHRRCVSCHRPGEVAPMALVTYADARPWARAIKTQVASREMPPWFADPKFSRALANDHSLTTAEIDTIVAWVDAGAPKGDGSPPTPPQFAEAGTTSRTVRRTSVLEMPADFEVPAEGVAAGLHASGRRIRLRKTSSSRPSSFGRAPSARCIIPM